MKTSLLASLSLAAVLLLSSLAGSTPQGGAQGSEDSDAPPAAAPQEKADRVAELESRVADLEKALQAERERVDAVLRYLEAQQRAARTLDAALDRVYELGFTKGINYGSRELLLDALHASAKAQDAPLPKAAPAKKAQR